MNITHLGWCDRTNEYVDLARDVCPAELVIRPGVAENPLPEVEAKEATVMARKSGVHYTPQ